MTIDEKKQQQYPYFSTSYKMWIWIKYEINIKKFRQKIFCVTSLT